MLWKLLDAVMVGLSLSAVVAAFAGWWPPPRGFPWFMLIQLAWVISRGWRVGHDPYPSHQGEHLRGR